MGLLVKYPYSCQILVTLEFSRQIFEKKNPPIPNFMKIRQVGVEMFHADVRNKRRTDVTKLIDAFRNFANAPKNIQANRKGKNDGVTPCPVVTGDQWSEIVQLVFPFVIIKIVFDKPRRTTKPRISYLKPIRIWNAMKLPPCPPAPINKMKLGMGLPDHALPCHAYKQQSS